MKHFNKSMEDVVDAFLRVRRGIIIIFKQCSGDLEATRNFLEGRRVTEWSAIEDLALAKQDLTSNDYFVLVKTKGVSEIEKRKIFLND